jgi:hypothetical protein
MLFPPCDGGCVGGRICGIAPIGAGGGIELPD